MSETCVKKIGEDRCGNEAVIQDKHDRWLCEKHYKEWVMRLPKKLGLFHRDTLTINFGGPLSKPEKCFMARAIKVPTYKYYVYEREDAGGGWYGEKQWVEYTEDNAYLVEVDGKIIGWMKPYYNGPASELLALDWEYAPHQVKQFAEKYMNSIKDTTTLTNK